MINPDKLAKKKQKRIKIGTTVKDEDYQELVGYLKEMDIKFSEFLDAGIEEFNQLVRKKKKKENK